MLTVEQTVRTFDQIVKTQVTKKKLIARGRLNGLKFSASVLRPNIAKKASWEDFKHNLRAMINFLNKQGIELSVELQETVDGLMKLKERPRA